MSIDVFGRKLERAAGSSRGPPGVGFKLTEDNQYDIDNKRMCNVAPPNELSDAVNLASLQRILSAEIQTVKNLITGLSTELKNLEEIVYTNVRKPLR